MALFLRARVDESPLTMTAAAKGANYSTTQAGDFLSGRRVSEPAFVAALLRITVLDPRQRRALQADADRLLHAARNPQERREEHGGDSTLAGQLERVRAQQVETYERLTRALEQQADLQEAARNSAQLVMVLLSMINTLADRVRSLSTERDGLAGRAGDRRELEHTQRRLARALDQERRAKEELDRAREKQRQAEDLAARVQRRVDELTDELNRLRADEATAPDDAVPPPPGVTTSADPVGDDIDQALARATTVNDTDEETLRRITDELQDTAEGEAPRGVLALEDGRPAVVPDIQDNVPTNPSISELDARHEHAYNLGEAGEYRTAVELFAELIAASTRILGPDHPDTLDARHGHAVNLGKADDHRQAVQLLAALIADSTRALGSDHPDTLTARHNHAFHLGEAGDRREAARLLAEVATDRTRALGPNHPNTLTARHNHAANLGEAGDRREAARLFAELTTDRTRILGPSHPDTLTTRHEHAYNLGKAGDRREAALLLAELTTDRTRILGPNHPATLTTRHNHAFNLGRAGERREAAQLFAELIADRTRILGPNHPATLTTRHNHAFNLGEAGDHHEAAQLLAEVATDRTRILGPEHPNTLTTHRRQAHFARLASDPPPAR
ncbi:tetratricopeptide repeat protein [Kitasatospora viridis]|uniref:Tetratricopeptide repeat protein n=2 Tax=Kitasatospora viridis TaxID=281105 RepID=A0A561UDB4_9ACTN|nr:tetratricopeptide repeat protein [Kitasatospora viridis]